MYNYLLFFLCLLCLFSNVVIQAQTTHQTLDWSSSYRWVHVDNVDSQKAHIFEEARIEWLRSLRQQDYLLADGRPLFWCARRGTVQTYLTFYPFSRFSDLDSRREIVKQTQSIVGQNAVDKYDTGDVALVAPHYTQVWQRANQYDFATTENEPLTELTANIGRIEIQQADLQQTDKIDQLWQSIRDALIAQKYPLVCRSYWSSIGTGELVRIWLAPDIKAFRTSPPIQTVVARQLGKQKSAAIFTTLKKLLVTHTQYEIERRPDLSNLGK
ncbi:MAG: hypothetical protein AB1489_08395 [Acidobacteriota bacterium]